MASRQYLQMRYDLEQWRYDQLPEEAKRAHDALFAAHRAWVQSMLHLLDEPAEVRAALQEWAEEVWGDLIDGAFDDLIVLEFDPDAT